MNRHIFFTIFALWSGQTLCLCVCIRQDDGAINATFFLQRNINETMYMRAFPYDLINLLTILIFLCLRLHKRQSLTRFTIALLFFYLYLTCVCICPYKNIHDADKNGKIRRKTLIIYLR